MKPAELRKLRSRIKQSVAALADEFPKVSKQTLARALMAEIVDTSLHAVGSLGTLWMVQRAEDLLGGRWSEETKATFIETANH